MAQAELTITVNLDGLASSLMALAEKIGELYELVPEYVVERESIIEDIESQIKALLIEEKENV